MKSTEAQPVTIPYSQIQMMNNEIVTIITVLFETFRSLYNVICVDFNISFIDEYFHAFFRLLLLCLYFFNELQYNKTFIHDKKHQESFQINFESNQEFSYNFPITKIELKFAVSKCRNRTPGPDSLTILIRRTRRDVGYFASSQHVG